MIKIVLGKVVQHAKQTFQIQDSDPNRNNAAGLKSTMVKNTLTIQSDDGTLVKVNKYTKPETNFDLEAGTQVQAAYEEKISQGKDGKTFTNNNIIKNGLTILSQTNVREALSPTVANTTGPGEVMTKPLAASLAQTASAVSRPNTFNANQDGAKRGAALNKAVDMLIHNRQGETISLAQEDELFELFMLAWNVSTKAENPQNLHTLKLVHPSKAKATKAKLQANVESGDDLPF